MAIRPVFTETVPFLGLGPGVLPSLPLCPGIFDSKFAFVNTVCQRYTNESFVIRYCINSKAQSPSFVTSQSCKETLQSCLAVFFLSLKTLARLSKQIDRGVSVKVGRS